MKQDTFPASNGGGASPIPPWHPRHYMDEREVVPVDDTRRTMRAGLIAAGLFFGIFVVFALLFPIAGAAIASGEVSVAGSRLSIEPQASGLVSEVLVREGQMVEAGEPLVRLNGIRSGATLRQAQAERDLLRATEVRLLAERDGAERLLFPPDLTSRSGDRAAGSAMAAQRALFERRRYLNTSDRAILDARLTAAQAQQTASARQLTTVQDELGDIRELYDMGLARKATLGALERNAAQLQADRTKGIAAVREANIDRTRMVASQRMEIDTELSRVQAELAQVEPKLEISRYDADSDMLRAPARGSVSGLAQFGPGSVVSAGQSLMQIVPRGRALIVEARIDPRDIDDVKLGAEATVRFSTVLPRGANSFKGRVITLSPARIDSPEGGYFRAQIALDDPAAAERGQIHLQPGLPASVTVKTESRSLFEYLVSPLGDAFSKSMREE